MACEYIANPVQTVALNTPIVFSDSIPCRRGLIYHEDGTGVFQLASRNNRRRSSCCCNPNTSDYKVDLKRQHRHPRRWHRWPDCLGYHSRRRTGCGNAGYLHTCCCRYVSKRILHQDHQGALRVLSVGCHRVC